MLRECEVTGRRQMSGNNVSHANNKTKRRFMLNLHTKKFWSEKEQSFIKLRVSNRGLRTIDKLGIDEVLVMIRKRTQKV
jgi:large subunit ribosomal protein L28